MDADAHLPGPHEGDGTGVRILRHRIRVEGDPDRVLALLTPEGERRWVEDWAPEYLADGEPELEEGLVFVTRAGGETTLWCVGELDHQARTYSYHRFTPGSRAALVTVSCRGEAGGPTDVTVRYEVTPLTPEGDETVAEMARGFVAEIEGWKEALEAVLAEDAAG